MDSYVKVIRQTAAMVSNNRALALSKKHGLHILDVTWEDSGRFHDSCVGPNISDMTIQVQYCPKGSRKYKLTCMPVIRTPNFDDISADVPLDHFYLLTGNQKGEPLKKVTLRQYLGNLREYLHDPDSWAGDGVSLLAERDTHVLASAQACFLPIPKEGKAEFNPVLFNYQSGPGNPAVLTILATREGTSATVIDNLRDAFDAGQTWGQRLFFNEDGQRSSLSGQRISDFISESDDQLESDENAAGEEKKQSGLNMVLLIQVPLKQKIADTFRSFPVMAGAVFKKMPGASDVEDAVIGHGEVEGPFTELDGLDIERDERFPIRVTVQFYMATSNGVLSPQDIKEIATQIDRVYQDGDYVGSLVTEGMTIRPTEHDGPKQEPPGWWNDFWDQYEKNTGQSREEAMEMLKRIRPHWRPDSWTELQDMLDDVLDSEQ